MATGACGHQVGQLRSGKNIEQFGPGPVSTGSGGWKGCVLQAESYQVGTGSCQVMLGLRDWVKELGCIISVTFCAQMEGRAQGSSTFL